jgi:hypothetical protein
MTEILTHAASDQIRKEMLSLVKSLKGQVLNADNFYVEVDFRKPKVNRKNHQVAAGNPALHLDALAREAYSCLEKEKMLSSEMATRRQESFL